MLHVYYGTMPNEDDVLITSITPYFEEVCEDEWMSDPLVKEIVLDVDKSEVVGPHLIESPVLGPIPRTYLSGGTQALILMMFDDSYIFFASQCGDNCAHWILEIAKRKELTINLKHLMDFGEGPFDIHVLNTDTVVHDREGLIRTYLMLKEQGDVC